MVQVLKLPEPDNSQVQMSEATMTWWWFFYLGFIHFEPSQSLGGAKTGDPREK